MLFSFVWQLPVITSYDRDYDRVRGIDHFLEGRTVICRFEKATSVPCCSTQRPISPGDFKESDVAFPTGFWFMKKEKLFPRASTVRVLFCPPLSEGASAPASEW